MRSKLGSFGKYLVLAAATLAVSCAAGEILLRYYRPQPLEATFTWPDGTIRHIPSFSFTYTSRGLGNRVTFNALGLRGPEVAGEKTPGVPRVLFLGDSLVEGMQVGDDEVLTAVMERLAARAGHRIEVINAGVAGYGTGEEMLLWRALGKELRPDIVLLGVHPNDVRNNVDRHTVVDEPGEPIRVRKPKKAPAGPAYEARKFLASRSHLYILARRGVRRILGDPEENRRRPDPNQEAYRDTGADRPLEAEEGFSTRRIPAVARGWTMTLAVISELKRSVEGAGARFEVVLFPTRYQVDDALWSAHCEKAGLDPAKFDLRKPQKIFSDWTKRFDVDVLDLLGDFRARNSGNSFYHAIEAHMNPAGHALAGQLIVNRLVEGGLLEKAAGGS